MRRLGALLAIFVGVVVLAAGAGAAGSSISADDYLGQWTPDTSSASQVAADVFSISTADETSARGVTGDAAIDFDNYCKSTNPNVQPVTYFTASTTNFGTFGGCVSGKTGGHIYTWDTLNGNIQVWYAHTGKLKGEPVLNGTLEVEHPSAPADSFKFRAHHPSVQFLAHVKFTHILKKGTHLAELTTVTGAGEFHILHVPQPCESSNSASVVSGDGTLAVKSVKIGGPNVVELDSLTVEPLADQTDSDSTFGCDHIDALRHVGVTVTKSDPAEKDACPVGAPGDLWLVDSGSGEKRDSLKLDIPKCHVDLVLSQSKAKKGSHVAIAETLNEKGY